jgi:hypothetical protein
MFLVKVNLSLENVSCALIKLHAMKTKGAVEVQLHAFLTSPLDGDECSASRSGLFNLTERTPNNHWIGECVGPRTGIDAMVKREIPVSAGNRTPVVQSRSLVTVLTELLWLRYMYIYFMYMRVVG